MASLRSAARTGQGPRLTKTSSSPGSRAIAWRNSQANSPEKNPRARREESMAKKAPKKEAASLEKDNTASYDAFKQFEGKRYTGMKIGRSHKWNYDPGVWKETKLTPDEWQINY